MKQLLICLLLTTTLGCGKFQQAQKEFNTGLKHSQREKWNEAIASYDRTIEIAPTHTEAYINRGHAYMNLGQFDQAIADSGKAIELNPKLPQAYVNRSACYMTQKQRNAKMHHMKFIFVTNTLNVHKTSLKHP